MGDLNKTEVKSELALIDHVLDLLRLYSPDNSKIDSKAIGSSLIPLPSIAAQRSSTEWIATNF